MLELRALLPMLLCLTLCACVADAEAQSSEEAEPPQQAAQSEQAESAAPSEAAVNTQGAQNNRTPCLTRAEFRQFDFWLGDWEVHDAQGARQGANRISSREGGCYLFEQWTGAGGGTGSSINYYDAARGRWVQHWVSQGGTQIQIEGGLDSDGSMQLVGKIYYLANGQQADFRGRWTPLDDGRVRQFFAQSTDGGENWTPWFEGFYSRPPPAEPATAQPDRE